MFNKPLDLISFEHVIELDDSYHPIIENRQGFKKYQSINDKQKDAFANI